MSDGRTRLRQALGALSLVAAAWSFTLVITRGVSFSVGPLHVSSRNAQNPALGALLLLAFAILAAPAGLRARTVADDLMLAGRRALAAARDGLRLLNVSTPPQVVGVLAALLVALTLLTSWTRGAYLAGGSDSYGYVSEAHLFATGRLRADSPLARAFPHAPPLALSPLGYRPAADGTDTLVPVYAPGLPLVMAAAERIGGMDAVYAVMPLLAALTVWCTYRIGVIVAGPVAGLAAALLVFATPVFIFALIGAPMSDIPVTGWWSLALLLLLRSRPADAGPALLRLTLAGFATGAAILTRPNLLLVAVVPGLFVLFDAARARAAWPRRLARVAAFSLPVVAACLTVAALNAVWYGSPLRSGYPAGLFNIAYWDDNIAQFFRWLTETQTPLLLLGFAAPAVMGWLTPRTQPGRRSEAFLLAGVALTVFASYLFYMPFDVWWYLRFLLPAYPGLAVLTCATLAALTNRFGAVMQVVSIAAVAGTAVFGLHSSRQMDAVGDYRYRIAAEWVRDHLPERALVVAMLHSGSVNHYSGLPIIRYDLIAGGDYESALTEIANAGYHAYLVVDQDEVALVQRLHGAGASGRLDWPPVAMLPVGNVTVWDLAEDRDAARASGRAPQAIPVPDFVRRRMP